MTPSETGAIVLAHVALVPTFPAPSRDPGGFLDLVLRSSLGGKLGKSPRVVAVVVIDHAETAVRPPADRCGRGAQDPQTGRSAARSGGLDPSRADDHPVLGRGAGAGHRANAGLQPEGGARAAGPLRRRGPRRA